MAINVRMPDAMRRAINELVLAGSTPEAIRSQADVIREALRRGLRAMQRESRLRRAS